MKIAICDDVNSDKECLFQSIHNYCQKKFFEAVITEYSSGEDLLEMFSQDSFDIIFLDIYMKKLTGIDTAQKLRVIDQNCLIVFVTSSTEHALEGFDVNALHYLIKPINDQKMAEVFERCKKKIHNMQKYIEVLSDRILVKIPVNSIQYIEVYDKACFIHKKTEKIKTYLSLEEFSQKLEPKFFLRCHRSYIVNMQAVVSVDEHDFILQSGVRVPIRQSEKRLIKQMYMDFLFSVARED